MVSHAASDDVSLPAALLHWLADIAASTATWLGFRAPKPPQRDPEWEAAIRRMGERLGRFYEERR